MWDIKLKATNEQTKKQELIDTDNSMSFTKRKGVIGSKGERQSNIWLWRFELGW